MPQAIGRKQPGFRGAVNRLLAKNVENLLAIPGKKMYRKFVQASKETAATQQAVLSEIIHFASDSVLGKKYAFSSIAKPREYQNRMPLHDYEDLRPYIERHKRGEADVLFPGKPLMYNITSGTTAQPKYIPITSYGFKRTIKDRGKLWLYGLMRDFPGVFKGKDLTVVSSAVDGHTEDGTPYGSVSGFIYQNIPEFMKLVHTVPYGVMTIKNYDSKVYTLLRFALSSTISVILTGNPATLINLFQRADAWKEDLIRDIRDGTLKRDLDIDPGLRTHIEHMICPDPVNARELERLSQAHRVLRPADYWPYLRLVNTWTNGNCRMQIPKLRKWLCPETPLLDFGYLSSEITAADLIDKDTGGSILQIQNGFYEFAEYQQCDRIDNRFYLAHELEKGKRYFIYITTFNGLYRYNMNDVVEVVGFFHTAPIIRFLFKGHGITSIQGEKLSEEQFIMAVEAAAKRTGIFHDFFVGFADCRESRYVLYIEFINAAVIEHETDFAVTVDEELGKVNMEYFVKRRSDRLKPVKTIALGKGAFDCYRQLRLQEGAHDGQIKCLHLSQIETTQQRMQRLLSACSPQES